MRAECSLLIKKRLKTDKVEEPFSQPSANAHETPGCRSPGRCPGHPRSVLDGDSPGAGIASSLVAGAATTAVSLAEPVAAHLPGSRGLECLVLGRGTKLG